MGKQAWSGEPRTSSSSSLSLQLPHMHGESNQEHWAQANRDANEAHPGAECHWSGVNSGQDCGFGQQVVKQVGFGRVGEQAAVMY